MLKRNVPMLIASLGGIIIIIAFFVPVLEDVSNELGVWFNILQAIAFVLGGGNLVKLMLRKISDRDPGWGYAVITLLTFAITLIVGLLKINVPPSESHVNVAWSGAYDAEGGAAWWVYNFAFSPLQATMFALLAFFVASAAFRAFRAKNAEATLLLVTAFIVLLGQTYAGYLMTKGLPPGLAGLTIPSLSQLIQDIFTAAGQRAIMIGIALGIVATALKIILGIDRSYIGSDSE